MKEISEREKKDKRFSMIMSGIVHGGLLLIFLLLVAWSPPDPPIPEYGMELNLGFEDEGSADLESEVDSPDETDNTTPPESEAESEETPEEVQEEVVEPETEEVQDPVEEVVEPVKPVEEVVEPVVTPVEEVVKAEETQKTESDVKAEEKKAEEPEKEKEVEVKPPVVEEKKEVEKPVEEKKEEPKKPEPKKDPEVVKKALMGKKSDTNSKDPAGGNQGNKLDERGNLGKPTGKKDSNGLAEDAGNLGVSLSLDGWAWDRAPSGKDASEIDGVILFQIKVDDRGVVREVTKMPGTTISDNTVVEFYKKEVQKLSFKRTLSAQASPISVGEIKFIIKTK